MSLSLTLLTEVVEPPIPIHKGRFSLFIKDDPLIKIYKTTAYSIPFLLLSRNEVYYVYTPDSDHSLDQLIWLGIDKVIEYKIENRVIPKLTNIYKHTRLTEDLIKEITDESRAKVRKR